MSSCIYVDFDENQLSDSKLVRARKLHECGECGDAILVGDLYEYAKGLYDGWWWKAKTCARCCNVRADYFTSWIHGEMVDLFMGAHGFDYRKGIPGDFPPCRGSTP